MAWERGRYYTRSRKVNGRVVREYVGAGVVGEMAASDDELERQIRHARRERALLERRDCERVARAVRLLSSFVETVARAALVVTGHHQHARGRWRRKRRAANQG